MFSEWRAEMRESVLRKKVAGQVFRWLDISGADFMSPILYLLISRKALKLSWWQLFLMSSRSFMRLAETFYKKYVLDCMCSPFTKITYMLSCPMSLEEFLRVIWDAVFWAAILILPPVKLNWQRSHCGLFFKSAACWNHSYDTHLSRLGPVSCVCTPEFPWGSLWGVAAVWWLLDSRCSFPPEFPQGSPAYISWWLQL